MSGVLNGLFGSMVKRSLAATGGTTSTLGFYKYHVFDSNGTFTVTSGGKVDIIVVGGGGGGGFGNSSNGSHSASSGGGGGIGYIYDYSLTPGNYSIVVGQATPAGGSSGNGPAGNTSSFASPGIVATGGGGGRSLFGPDFVQFAAPSGTVSTTIGATAASGGTGGSGLWGPVPTSGTSLWSPSGSNVTYGGGGQTIGANTGRGLDYGGLVVQSGNGASGAGSGPGGGGAAGMGTGDGQFTKISSGAAGRVLLRYSV